MQSVHLIGLWLEKDFRLYHGMPMQEQGELQVDSQHRLTGARWQASPHWDERPAWAQPELVVIHCVSLPEGRFGTGFPEALFLGHLDCSAHPDFADLQGLQVAPHLFIDRQGQVQQFVEFDKRAWHAGVSSWCVRPGCNGYSIGIELEGSVHTPFTLEQYDSLADVSMALLRRYPSLSVEGFVGHNEIAPGRKQDPGPYFDWCGFLLRLHHSLALALP